MFKDYYKILGISSQATQDEIKSAYHIMSLKWHPDRNPGCDTTCIMQDINEAYAILRDAEAKRRYDIEYESFNEQFEHAGEDYSATDSNFGTENESESESESESEDETANNHEEYQSYQQSSWTYNYDVHDENLKNDIKTAREYAREFVSELRHTSNVAAKGAWEGMKPYLFVGIVLSIIVFIVQVCTNTI